jgi:hypothetical protein
MFRPAHPVSAAGDRRRSNPFTQIGHPFVHKHLSGLETAGDPMRPAQIVRPYSRDPSIIGVVGDPDGLRLILERDDDHDRSEYFFSRDAHVVADVRIDRPFTTAFHIGDMLDGFERIIHHAPSLDHIIPGHDPLVMSKYPAARPYLEGTVVRLDVPPKSAP